MSQGKMATHLEGNRPIPQRNGILKNLSKINTEGSILTEFNKAATV